MSDGIFCHPATPNFSSSDNFFNNYRSVWLWPEPESATTRRHFSHYHFGTQANLGDGSSHLLLLLIIILPGAPKCHLHFLKLERPSQGCWSDFITCNFVEQKVFNWFFSQTPPSPSMQTCTCLRKTAQHLPTQFLDMSLQAAMTVALGTAW